MYIECKRHSCPGTVFLDSCFAGINGIAEMFSTKMPEHWVMGGVVSLESYIKAYLRRCL